MHPRQPDVYSCPDDDLGQMLDKLFAEGAQEVEIAHPLEGSKVITRSQFQALKATINREQGSPAERMMRRKQYERAKDRAMRIFIEGMAAAEVREIDPDNGAYGFDVYGKPIDVEGMDIAYITDYPPAVEILPNEIGCLVDPMLDRPPIRLVATHTG